MSLLDIYNELEGLYENIYDFILERKYVVLRCHICGQKLAPFISHHGPKGCGWVKVKGKYTGYICHQCYDHGMCVSHEGLDELKAMVKERNEETDRLISCYKYNHPWIKIKYL